MTQHYIGVDLHKASFQACAVTVDGARLWEDRFPRTPDGIAAFLSRCAPHGAVAVEASTPTWHFADALVDQVGELRIVDALHGTRRADPTGRWARRLAVRKGALKARVAIARSLCADIFAAWPTSS